MPSVDRFPAAPGTDRQRATTAQGVPSAAVTWMLQFGYPLRLFEKHPGMPMGMHFAAAHNQEQTLLELETAAPCEKMATRS